MSAEEPERFGGHLGTCDALFGAPSCTCDKDGPVAEDVEGLRAALAELEARYAVLKAVADLDALDGSDPEVAHGNADRILLTAVPTEVREAYTRLTRRAKWWGAS